MNTEIVFKSKLMTDPIVDVLVMTKSNQSASLNKELSAYEKAIVSNLKDLSPQVKLTMKSSSSYANSGCGKDFTIYIGYDYKILSHFFSKLGQDTFFIFLGSAGDGCEKSLSNLMEDCTAYMEEDPLLYQKVTHVWSYKEVLSFIKQRLAKNETVAAA